MTSFNRALSNNKVGLQNLVAEMGNMFLAGKLIGCPRDSFTVINRSLKPELMMP